jgi:hypothetical protein
MGDTAVKSKKRCTWPRKNAHFKQISTFIASIGLQIFVVAVIRVSRKSYNKTRSAFEASSEVEKRVFTHWYIISVLIEFEIVISEGVSHAKTELVIGDESFFVVLREIFGSPILLKKIYIILWTMFSHTVYSVFVK